MRQMITYRYGTFFVLKSNKWLIDSYVLRAPLDSQVIALAKPSTRLTLVHERRDVDLSKTHELQCSRFV